MVITISLVLFLVCVPMHFQENDLKALSKFGAIVERSGQGGEVVRVRIDSKDFADVDLRHLAKLANLESLTLNGTKITDDGLAQLSLLPNLRYLVLKNNANVTGRGFANLKAQKLETLVLAGCPISDEGLQRICALGSLKSLNVSKSKVTDEGLGHLGKLEKLDALWLSNTGVTDKGVKNLKGLANMKSLFLSQTAIDDGTIAYIVASAKDLQRLDVAGTKMSDQGVEHLARASKLVVINVQRTKISEPGIIRLRELFPKASIEYGRKN